jgi:hypothetical protein
MMVLWNSIAILRGGVAIEGDRDHSGAIILGFIGTL